MTRVFVAANTSDERLAFALLLKDMQLEVVGEAADWGSTMAEAPASQADLLLVDWDLLPSPSSPALDRLREAWGSPVAILLISRLDAHRQAALSSGADEFVSKSESAERVVARFRAAIANADPPDIPL